MLSEEKNEYGSQTRLDPLERERMLLEHLPQVHYIARRIHDRLPPQIPLEDLVHAGVLGLIDAVDKYDSSQNVQLQSYARFRIRGAILDSLRELDWGPRKLRRQARRIEQAHSNLKAKLGRAPSEPELAAALQMNLQEFQHLLGELRGLDLGSLEEESSSGAAGEAAIANNSTPASESPFDQCLREEMSQLLAEALQDLNEQERRVMALYHMEELTMKEVGAVLGVGESRISQIHSTALIRLRARMRERMQTGVPPVAEAVERAASQRGWTWKKS
jgi:RNA polymerase sigma factor for flagellar operon FliA